MIDNRRCRCNQFQIIFPFQTFLDNIHMEQPEETATKSETKCLWRLRHIFKRCIIELQLFQCHLQLIIIFTFNRIEAAENHRQRLTVSGKRFFGTISSGCNCVTYCTVSYIFYARCYISHRSTGQSSSNFGKRRKVSYFCNRIHFPWRHHLYLHTWPDLPIHNTDISNSTFVRVEDGIKNQTAERFIGTIFRRRN